MLTPLQSLTLVRGPCPGEYVRTCCGSPTKALATLGNDHKDNMASMTNLANLLQQLGRLEEAEALSAEAEALGGIRG